MEAPARTRRPALFFAILLFIIPLHAVAAVGRTPGFASVSADGEAVYTVPFWLPPGTSGMTPVLSLEYRHRTTSGLLGIGWSIGGLSQISKCDGTIAQDLGRGTNNKFCLDGQRLISLEWAAYGEPSGEYRTEIESFARIRAVAGASSGPGHFVVDAADGRIYEYGATADSRIDRSAGSTTRNATAWALNRIRDRSGNVIDYGYIEDVTNGSFRIKTIRYNSNPGAAVAASHQVTFIYENRPSDAIDTGYVDGEPVRQVVRLVRIEILHDASILRRYFLDYEPALSTSGRSRLTSIKECAGTGSSCLAPTTLAWQDPTPGFEAESSVTATLPPVHGAASLPHVIDINGDGRLDYVWPGGSTLATSTIRYRLGTATGFGVAVDSGIPCPHGPGRPFDSNGDGRMDLLLAVYRGDFMIVAGRENGLAAPVSTGIAVPDGIRDYRGLDFNGDGLGDIAWSEAVGHTGYDQLFVRARYQLRSGSGYQALTTLYAQGSFSEATGGKFIGHPGRVDFNGDGAEDLLLDEQYSVRRISYGGEGSTEYFDGASVPAGVVLDFNDDGSSDYAYKHVATGTLRVRLGSGIELLGPAWNGSASLLAHDWNDDGRDDVLVGGATYWLVAISNGETLAAPVSTGIRHEGLLWKTGLDVDGDGLQDLITHVDNQVRVRLKKGVPADLLLAATDGFGVSAEFLYNPLTDGVVYTRGTGAVYPDQDVQTSEQVVAKLTTTDASGTGAQASTGFRYEGLRRNLHGRGSLGFRKQTVTDLAPQRMTATEIGRRQEFPYIGLPESVVIRQKSGKNVSRTSIQWSNIDFDRRSFPYPATTTARRYEVSGTYDGSEITRTVRSIAAIDASSGLVTDETTTVTEMAGGVNAASSASLRMRRSALINDTANWCLGKPQDLQLTASHTLAGGEAITRHATATWDATKCRLTQRRIAPGDSQWQVIYALAYDAFGNLTSEKITGAGMTARTMGITWDSRGEHPVSMANPLGQKIQLAWDAASGLPLKFTDPNGLTTSWAYDAFGRPTQETLPDGTSTMWARQICSGCDPRSIYRLTQSYRDNAGVTVAHAGSSVEVDRNERGFRFTTQQKGGGYAVSTIDRDDRGLITRSYLPHWDGGTAAGYWAFTYDLLGRRTGAQLLGANGVARSIEMQFDGLTLTARDPLDHVTTATRTAWGRLAQGVDALGATTRFEHDSFGNLLRVRDALNNVVASVGYNARGMKLTHTDTDMGTWSWTRNALGETTVLRDAKGQVQSFQYDLLGRITKRIAPEGTDLWTWGKSAANKDIGRLVSVAGPGYAESFTYDGISRPASRTIATDASFRYEYAYNPLGLLETITYPAAGAGRSFKIRHEYDAGRVSAIRNAFAPGEPFWTLNAVDASGKPLDLSLGSAVRVVSGFDPLRGTLEYRQTGTGTGSGIQNLEYVWDANDNLRSRSDLNLSLTETFGYDALDRLATSRRNGALNLELDYDATGNIRHKSDVCPGTTACYSYHAQRRHVLTAAAGQNFTHDANGNMTSRAGAGITWTSGNLPSSIAHSNGNYSQFVYGPVGDRWKQVAKHGGTTETTLYAGELMERVARGSATTWRHYVMTPTGPAAVHLRYSDGSASAMWFLTHDHLGSIDRIVDADGDVVVAESSAPFGRRRDANWTGVPTAGDLAKIAAVTRDGFTGHEHLDNLELIHMNGRVYDPHLGRFISADPYVMRPFYGQGLNRYAYAWNNPLAFVDPSGFDPPPCVQTQQGNCAQVTVIGVSYSDGLRFLSPSIGQIESARERDPCGQNSDAWTCYFGNGVLVSPAHVVQTASADPASTLSRGRLDFVQGFAARTGNLIISASPVTWLFGADPDFDWFEIPESELGRRGAADGNVANLVGGFAGVIRKGGQDTVESASAFARSWQGKKDIYSNIDRFKDIVLKKGTIVYALHPGQGFFYTTQSALRRAGGSSSTLHHGLQIAPHREKPPRMRYAAYEVLEDVDAAFSLAIANSKHGPGRLPQIVVPSFETSLQYLGDYSLGP